MFVTLEGIEGCGKTTQIRHIRTDLEAAGHTCIVTREPGGTRLGRQIRTILLDPESAGMAPMAELLLYFADRAEHLQKVVRPALASGQIVVSDRFFDATVVYQGVARGLAARLVEDLHRSVFDGLRPDLTLLLDLAPEMGLERAWNAVHNGGRTADETRFETEAIDFHRHVRDGYLERARREPDRIHVIDAALSEMQVRDRIRSVITGVLAARGLAPPG